MRVEIRLHYRYSRGSAFALSANHLHFLSLNPCGQEFDVAVESTSRLVDALIWLSLAEPENHHPHIPLKPVTIHNPSSQTTLSVLLTGSQIFWGHCRAYYLYKFHVLSAKLQSPPTE
eukprot:m.172937 g.172937  ORF g.172937 m.172937 type:complete len:117 (-) comp14843_c0_seq11:372-722(-)